MLSCEKTQRRFTEAAREAAALARRRKREHREQFPEEHQLVMVVVRGPDDPRAFSWQIRRFGQMHPVRTSDRTFPDAVEAARSGQAIVDEMRAGLASTPAG